KIDYIPNSKHGIWLRGNTQMSHTSNTGFGNGAVPLIAGTHGVTPTYAVASAWTWNISPESLNELRANFNRNMANTAANCLDIVGNYGGPGATKDGSGAPNGSWAQS